MSVWAARDQDGTLALFDEKPERPLTDSGLARWQPLGDNSLDWNDGFGEDPLPDLKWEDEPVEVKLTVERVQP